MGTASSAHTKRPSKKLRPRTEEKTSSKLSSIDSLDKRFQDLQSKAAGGDFQSQIRLAAISKLLDPCLSFLEQNLSSILNRGYPKQVERGLKLYRTMSKLIILCEPLGNKTGPSCRLRLIDFEDLTWEQLLDIRGPSFELLMRATNKHKKGENLDGLRLLSPEERQLYERIRPYFGGRRRPTLKYVARALIGGKDAKLSDKTVLNHLAAVRDFGREHKEDLGFSWYFISRVDSYGGELMTGREFVFNMQLQLMKALTSEQVLSQLRAHVAKVAKLVLTVQSSASVHALSALKAIRYTTSRQLQVTSDLSKK
jgi:hypothetical protein